MLLSFRRWLQFCQTSGSPFLCGCDFSTGILGWGLFLHVIILAFAMVWDFSLLSSMAVRISSFGILEAGFLVFGFVVTSLVLIFFISHLQSRSVLLLRFARLGRHQTVQLCISWERIFKRHQIPGAADQAVAGTHIGDVG